VALEEEHITMVSGQIRRHEMRIAEEEKLAREATTSDAALAHQQIAMLYRSELAIIRRRGPAR
jgi:hypothetical protein